jgi:hypothetical protein
MNYSFHWQKNNQKFSADVSRVRMLHGAVFSKKNPPWPPEAKSIFTMAVMVFFVLVIPVLAGKIHDAAREGDLAKVKTLLTKDPKFLDIKDKDGRTALHWACRGVHGEIVKLLAASGAGLNARDNNGVVPLHSLAYRGQAELVKLLAAKGAEVNAKMNNGNTSLHLAAAAGHKECAATLVSLRAKLNIKNNEGWTPLHFAEYEGHKQVAELLILKGAKQNPPPFPVLKGEYLGQKKPGLDPEVFAPGIISTDRSQFNAAFSPDGKEFYFSITRTNRQETMMYSKQVKGQWTEPQFAPFCSNKNDCDPIFSRDGNRLYFISTRPKKNAKRPNDWDIWFVDRTGEGWSEPKNIGSPVNSDDDEYYVSLTKDKTIYFASNRKGGKGSFDIYRSRFVDGHYAEPENLGSSINTKHLEHDPFIAFDESYLLFTSVDRPEGYGTGDLYISLRKADGTWTKAKNMGDKFNTKGYDFCPIVSPDGKFFFFTSRGGIYWVDAKIIEKMRKN